MQRQVSPIVLVIAIVVVLAIVAGIYWFTQSRKGSGDQEPMPPEQMRSLVQGGQQAAGDTETSDASGGQGGTSADKR